MGRTDWAFSRSRSRRDFPGPVVDTESWGRRGGGRQCDETGSSTEQMCRLEIRILVRRKGRKVGHKLKSSSGA